MKKFDIKMLNNHCSVLFLNNIPRAALLGVVFSVAGLPSTGFFLNGSRYHGKAALGK
jgi:hypothetical protein